MSEDLAIDVGLAVNTDEYESFVSTVDNILELGCQYNKNVTSDIIDRCKTSELDIAILLNCRTSTDVYIIHVLSRNMSNTIELHL